MIDTEKQSENSTGSAWDRLLKLLVLSDQQVTETVVRACRIRFRVRASDELCQTVIGETYAAVLRRLQDEPTRDYFRDPDRLLAYVFTIASNARGVDIWERKRTVETASLGSHDPTARTSRDADRSELLNRLADCGRACNECLSDADEEVRRVFLVKCEGVHATGVIPTGRELARTLGVSEPTVCRLWALARAHFSRKCGLEVFDTAFGGESVA